MILKAIVIVTMMSQTPSGEVKSNTVVDPEVLSTEACFKRKENYTAMYKDMYGKDIQETGDKVVAVDVMCYPVSEKFMQTIMSSYAGTQ